MVVHPLLTKKAGVMPSASSEKGVAFRALRRAANNGLR